MRRTHRGADAFARSHTTIEYGLLLGCLLGVFFLPLNVLIPIGLVGTGVVIRACNARD